MPRTTAASRRPIMTGAGEPAVLALDLGTSSVRSALYDTAARPIGPPAAVRRYTWQFHGGGATLPADALLSETYAALDAAVGRARAEERTIVGIAVAAFWHGLLGLDREDVPCTPLYSWADQRGAGVAERLRREMDGDAVHRRTGCFLHPSYPAVRLAWLREADRARFDEVRAWVSFPEYLEARLFGRRRCSVSIASATGLLDVHRLEWDEAWLDRLGLAPERLSVLVDSGEPVRGMLPGHARRWPELAEAAWYPALGDGACANLGSGAVGADAVGLTVGTSAAMRVLWAAESVEVPADLWCYRLDARHWVAGRALSNGGNGIARLADLLDLGPGEVALTDAAAVPPDGHGLTVLPFLVPERGPGADALDAAAVWGLTEATTPAHLVRAWMEAVAYQLADTAGVLERATGPVARVMASGGALYGSPFWAGIIADALGRAVVLPDDREATARGAAIVALERMRLLPHLAAAPPGESARFEPDPDRHRRYRRGAARQHALRQALRAAAAHDESTTPREETSCGSQAR